MYFHDDFSVTRLHLYIDWQLLMCWYSWALASETTLMKRCGNWATWVSASVLSASALSTPSRKRGWHIWHFLVYSC